ncbi:methyl-accepting chemotaxis protein [Sporosarcina sp. Sa2YVA2]|uniref:Methyl-accepting chemotaxis protein n=1 Tax=Sporosarcina quadrami TaxID=2762234 RepID=A0ABR8UAL3_9BACL|nr:methyl-accepting chemotaxis protein [Sporosarcina quadrami]MBD7985068.1 methyl-accepting chemotaxis protein [Sporosarcina quadrami]
MRFSVSRKLWAGFLSLVLLMVIAGVLNYMSIPRIIEKYEFLIDDRMEKVIILEQLSTNQNELSNDLRGYLLYKEVIYLKSRRSLLESFNEKVAQLDATLHSEESRAMLEDIKTASVKYTELTESAIASFNNGNDEGAVKAAGEAEKYQSAITKTAKDLIAFQRDHMDKTKDEVAHTVKWTGTFIVGVVLFSVILSVLIATIISRSITKPVKLMTGALKHIAKGNFAIEPLVIRNQDEIGEMATAFNEMSSDLRNVITGTRDAAIQLAAQSEQMTASSQESLAASEMVASIAEKNLLASDMQVKLVNESSEAMAEMATGISRITEDNEAMLTSTSEVSRLVGEGAEFMNEVTSQMDTISTSIHQSAAIINELAEHSQNIRKVTGMISGIAEQTNLLALNAAIEAARAGEQGKGFAVVANEVRNLAEQSKESAQEIERMIKTIIQNVSDAVKSADEGNQKVAEGLGITEKTSVVFNRIEVASLDVNGKVQTVSVAIEQIRAMSEAVSEGARKIQELAVQTSAEAQSTSAATEEQLASNEEIASSAQMLSEVAEKLQNDMGHFTV